MKHPAQARRGGINALWILQMLAAQFANRNAGKRAESRAEEEKKKSEARHKFDQWVDANSIPKTDARARAAITK
jgi:hypothetical protein